MFIIVLVCFENIGVISRIQEKFHFTLQAGPIFGLAANKAEPLREREKEPKSNGFSKKVHVFQKEKLCQEVEVHL